MCQWIKKKCDVEHLQINDKDGNYKCSILIGVPLDTGRLGQTLTLEHKFLKGNLMRPWDKILSVTYCVNYVSTNSHYSISFRDNRRIYISRLFEDIGKLLLSLKTWNNGARNVY